MKKCLIALLLVAFCSVGYGASEELSAEWYQKGIAAVKMGHLKNAKVCFEAALYFDADHANASKALSMTEERLDKMEAASGKSTRIGKIMSSIKNVFKFGS